MSIYKALEVVGGFTGKMKKLLSSDSDGMVWEKHTVYYRSGNFGRNYK